MKPSSFWPNHPHSACRADNFSSRPRWVCLVRGVRAKSYCPQVNNSAPDSRPLPHSPRVSIVIRVRLPLDHRPIATISSPRLGTAGGSDHSPVPFDYCQIVEQALFPSHRGWFLTKCQPKDHDHHMKIGLLSALRCADARCLPGQPRNCAASSVQPFTFGRPRSRHRASVRCGHCKHHRLHCS